MGHLYGQLRQRRRLLPLQLQRRPRLRPHRPRRHLRPRMPAHQRGPHVRNLPAAEEDAQHQDQPNVVQAVNAWDGDGGEDEREINGRKDGKEKKMGEEIGIM